MMQILDAAVGLSWVMVDGIRLVGWLMIHRLQRKNT